MRLGLYQPEIPQNAGALMRLAACLDVPLDIVEPCGFSFGDKYLRRAGLDYAELAQVTRYSGWNAFADQRPGRLILATRRTAARHVDFAFRDGDTLLFGRESDGVPAEIRAACDHAVAVPIRPQTRSLNLAVAASMTLGEALRQTGGFPDHAPTPEPQR